MSPKNLTSVQSGEGGGLENPKMDNVICEPSQRRFFVLLQRLSAGFSDLSSSLWDDAGTMGNAAGCFSNVWKSFLSVKISIIQSTENVSLQLEKSEPGRFEIGPPGVGL